MEKRTRSQPVLLLVHGAAGGGWQFKQVAALMEAKGWNREALAFHSGLSFRTIESIFSGERGITLASAVRLGKALGFDYEQIAPKKEMKK